MKELEKTYNPADIEDRLYQKWLDSKYFHADAERGRRNGKKPFTIVMPPPNITGQLHMGHALDNTMQDILIRYKRMQGYEALWQPGTDHAAIATEVKVINKLKEQGIDKHDLGREGFLEKAWEWKEEYGSRIVKQLHKLGSSADWDRERFTMDEWCLSSNKKGRITSVQVGGHDSWVMYGPAFLSRDFSNQLIPLIEEAYHQPGTEQWYWEQVVVDHIKELDFSMNCQPADQVYEFENLEELRLFDPKYQNHSDNAAMQLVAHVFNVKEEAIHNIRCLKSGMTNQSFLFELDGKHYICRIPGPGTEFLINRKEEEAVYKAVTPLGITEHILYFDGKTGYKIAQYYEGARNADAKNPQEMAACMEMLRKLHHSGVTVPHTFRIRERIDFYERICRGHEEMLFEDYPAVRARMNELMDRLDTLERPCCLSHIDSVADNFLFLPDGSLRLIDWEYAGMCDPLIDIAMCSIYSYYSQEELDHLLEEYLQHAPSDEERFVTYAYAALGGFLWALWAVFKSMEGREFGDYTIVMYRYAKNYYRKIVSEGLLKL